MRVLYLANNRLGPLIAQQISDFGDEIVGLVMHPPAKQKFAEELLKSTKVDPSAIFDASRLREPSVLDRIAALRPDIGMSVFFGFLVRPDLLRLLPHGCINLHPALLPHNRGANPNVWSIVDRSPAGVTLHYMDEGIDTGDIIAQRHVPVDVVDTGESLQRNLEAACIDLFHDTWPLIRESTAVRKPQLKSAGTFHRLADLSKIDEIDLNQLYTARNLIDILRARTFPPYSGAYFWDNGRKVFIRLQLICEEGREESSSTAASKTNS